MICSKCGAQLPDESLFCGYCGSSLKQTPEVEPIAPPTQAEEPVATAAEEAMPVPPVEAQPDSPVAVVAPPKKKKKKGLKIFLAIVAALVVVGILAPCLLGSAGVFTYLLLSDRAVSGEPNESVLPSSAVAQRPDETPSSKPTESPTIPSTPPIVEKIDLVLNEADLVYEMTDGDVDYFYELMAQLKENALRDADGDTVMSISDQVDDWYYYMDAQLSIAAVLYYCDLEDEAASQLYLDCTDALTQAYNDYMEMAQELYASDFLAKDRFFEDWSEADIARLEAYTPEIMELEQRNSEIEVAYQSMQNDDNMYTKMVPLYIEMVQNNNRIAQLYGYSNYYEYAYAQAYNRDYGAAEIAAMREYTSTYLADAALGAYETFYYAYMDLSWTQQNALEEFMYDSYQEGYEDEIENYLATLPYQAREDMLSMFNGNIVLADQLPYAQEGAFTTAIGEDRCICFFGPGYCDALTVIHEVGHYYGGMHTYLNEIPLDLAETQSQGNEWLFMSFLKTEMDSELYDATVSYKIYNDLVTILLCVIIDEFEERVYTHPNIANLTSDDLDAIMEDVCDNYGGIDYINDIATDVQHYWRMVVVEQPVYYISYGVSAIAAINVYTIASEDYEQAVGIYCSLIEGLELEIGFLGNLDKAGLDGPFDETVYDKLYNMVA